MATADTVSCARLSNKESNHFQSSSNKNGPERRKTAAERLEADRLKYVKSAEARQRKTNASPELPSNLIVVSSNLSHDPTLSNSLVKIERCDNNNCVHGVNQGELDEKQRHKLTRSNTDANIINKPPVDRLRSRSTTDYAASLLSTSPNNSKSQNESRQHQSPKNPRNNKFSSYLNKAKESLKSVSSSIVVNGLAGDDGKSRQSRSTAITSSKYRSSSVGANLQRQVKSRLGFSDFIPKSTAPSPRTHLKNVRQNLKKVKMSPFNEKSSLSPIKQSQTFLVIPKKNSNKSKILNTNIISRKSSMPLAIIDSNVASTRNQTPKDNLFNLYEEKVASCNQFSNSDDYKDQRKSQDYNSSKTDHTKFGGQGSSAQERLKISTESSFQSLSSFSDVPTSTFSNSPRLRKSWSRAPVSNEFKKSGSRVSFHEDCVMNHPGSRKSFSEALEDLLIPSTSEDDIDTAYNSMSPDASLDCKTLLAPSNSNAFDKSDIGNLYRTNPKTPESSRSRTPTCDDGIVFQAPSVNTSPLELSERPSSTTATERVEKSDISYNFTEEKTNESNGSLSQIKQVESVSTLVNLKEESLACSMLAPKQRKEVAPDYSINKNSAVPPTHDENTNTLQSHNTSSSASADINKPLTALTAADLKPQRRFQGVKPLKPAVPYHIRANPKRHINYPVSPNLSPIKHQLARMTSSQESKSSSSTPHSSLKRTPASSISSSLKRNRQRSKSDVSFHQNELDKFFSTMGMDDSLVSPLPSTQDTLFTTAPFGSESDFSFAGASAYVRDSLDGSMDVDPSTAGLANAPSVSIIEKNARVMRWLMSCRKPVTSHSTPPRSPCRTGPIPALPPRSKQKSQSSEPPPIPPRVNPQLDNAVDIHQYSNS